MTSIADLCRFLTARRPYLLDATVALALVLVTAVQEFAGPAESKTRDVHDTRWWLFGVVMVAGLLIQHRWPVWALLLAGIGALGHQFALYIRVRPLDFAVLIILYTLASVTRARWISLAALGAALAGAYASSLIHPALDSELFAAGTEALARVEAGAGLVRRYELIGSSPGVLVDAFGAEFGTLLLVVVAFALGDAVRSRRAHLRTLEQRAGDLEREQQQRVALATAAERNRITRDLHDVVAHGLSVIVMLAQGGAAALHRRRPAEVPTSETACNPSRSSVAPDQTERITKHSAAGTRRIGVVGGQPRDASRFEGCQRGEDLWRDSSGGSGAGGEPGPGDPSVRVPQAARGAAHPHGTGPG